MTARTLLASLSLLAAAFLASPVGATGAGPDASSCTAGSSSSYVALDELECDFHCDAGDTVHVQATSRLGVLAQGQASCGTAYPGCTGTSTCTADETTSSSGDGVCRAGAFGVGLSDFTTTKITCWAEGHGH